MRPAKALAERFLRQSSFLALAVCLGAFVPAAWAQRQGGRGRPGEMGAAHASERAGAPAASRPHSGFPVARQHREFPGRAGVAARPVARPGRRVTIHAAPLRPASNARARENETAIPLELSTAPRSAPRTASAAPAYGGNIVIAWPAPAKPANRSARPSSPAPRSGSVAMRANRLPRPVALPRRGTGRNAFRTVSPGTIVFRGGFEPRPFLSANPFFGEPFGFASFGFSPFFFSSGFCPFCFSPALGLPLLSVDPFGFGPPFFLPFNRPFFFGGRFFRRRFFRQPFFGPQLFFGFFPEVWTEAEEYGSNAAPAVEEEDPAIIPSAVTGGAPSEAESMAAAPDHRRPRTTLLVLRDGSVYSVVDYWLGSDGRFHYVTTYGGKNVIPLERVDVFKSMEVNLQRGGDFILDSGPHIRAR
jgi:hypothetical protein